MRRIRNLSFDTGLDRPLHLALGMFDGLHLGHQAVIRAAVNSADCEHGVSGVLTFNPHPSRLFNPNNPTRLIQPVELKANVIQSLGVDYFVEQAFTKAFAAIEAHEFLDYLREKCSTLAGLYCGENFRFGKGRAGDVDVLIKQADACGLRVFTAERIKENGIPVSSTRIRAALGDGEMGLVNSMLGYCYFCRSTAIEGRQLGRTIGFPTLNLRWNPECRPRYGVYAVEIRRNTDGNHEGWQPGVANYGLRPTVDHTTEPLLEVHVLEDTDITYGDSVTVRWIAFLRAEQKFESVNTLREQISRDRAHAETLLRKR